MKSFSYVTAILAACLAVYSSSLIPSAFAKEVQFLRSSEKQRLLPPSSPAPSASPSVSPAPSVSQNPTVSLAPTSMPSSSPSRASTYNGPFTIFTAIAMILNVLGGNEYAAGTDENGQLTIDIAELYTDFNFANVINFLTLTGWTWKRN